MGSASELTAAGNGGSIPAGVVETTGAGRRGSGPWSEEAGGHPPASTCPLLIPPAASWELTWHLWPA